MIAIGPDYFKRLVQAEKTRIVGEDIPPVTSVFDLKSRVRAKLVDRSGSMVIVEVSNTTAPIGSNGAKSRKGSRQEPQLSHQLYQHKQASGVTTVGKLQGKVAVITGGTTGIGFAAAKLFVEEGAYVVITGRRQKELDEAVKAIGDNVTGVQGDVSKLADLDRLYQTVKAQRRRIDVVFANAGLAEFAALGNITEEHFDRLFNVNVKGALFTVQKALPLMNDGGSIILTGSVASIKGTPAFWVYGATKAAIRNFVRAWTIELKNRRIRSNVLSPGPTETPLVDLQLPEAIARIVSTIPMGRMGASEEIAKAALFLASDDSSFVTGVELFVDGGRGQI
jgi:NAD(P)-dependent dehydrogenase (short-subunit alcohol dehydrogenase family)